jgi:hypothetical protein
MLKLPERADLLDVRCPLCGHSFTLNDEAVAPIPLARVVPLDSSSSPNQLRDADRAALARLSGWLRAAGIFTLLSLGLHLAYCSTGLAPFPRQGRFSNDDSFFLFLGVVGHGIAGPLQFLAAWRVYDVGGRAWLWFPVLAARGLAALHLIGAIVYLFTATPGGQRAFDLFTTGQRSFDPISLLLGVTSLAVCLVNLMAERAYQFAVARRAVRERLDREPLE